MAVEPGAGGGPGQIGHDGQSNRRALRLAGSRTEQGRPWQRQSRNMLNVARLAPLNSAKWDFIHNRKPSLQEA